jgi:hypothetical protein
VRSVLEKNRNSPARRFVDLSYGILIVAVLIALVFIVLLSRENLKQRKVQAQLKSRLTSAMGTISGSPEAQKGDIVPSFEGVTVSGRSARVVYDGRSKYVLFIFSVQCDACLGEIATWNSIARRVKNEKHTVLGMIEGSSSVTVPPVDFDVVHIPDMSVQRAYRVVAVPLVMVVSENGKVEWVHYGTLSDANTNELLSVIDANSNSKAR